MQELGTTRSLQELQRLESQDASDVCVKVFLEFTICNYLFIYLSKKGIIPGQLETYPYKNSIYHSDFNLVIHFALEMVRYKKHIFIVPVWQSNVNLSCWLQLQSRQNAKATIWEHWKIKADGLWKSNLDRVFFIILRWKKKLRIHCQQAYSTRNDKGILHTEGKWYHKEIWISGNEEQQMVNI